ncbi:hypothetical protein [Cypionkella sp. TWP1-2-1b2]|uniref:hypothetical protein n=1 Tax=Cypionkella sp. TWP1-2-1b2 TaxID=2804675 RepID=UPI003CE6F06A
MPHQNPAPGNEPGLPNLKDVHFNAMLVADLFAALVGLQDFGGRESGPIFAVARASEPLAREFAADLERVM